MLYIVTLCFIALDFLTGLIKAFCFKEFNSSVMRQGMYHKIGSIISVVLGVLVDFTTQYIDIGVDLKVTIPICAYIIIMEIGSIIENIGKINPDIVPEKLRECFYKLKIENCKKEDEQNE